MKLRFLVWLLCVALLTVGIYSIDSLLLQHRLAEKTVRLHVVANSDSAADQARKLRVRDAVLDEVRTLTAQCRTAREARTVLAAALPQITSAAQSALAGSDCQAVVTLQKESFDTRRYATFTLPAGRYPSLRVSIGAGEGHNWWCVVFPSLCEAATADAMAQSARVGGFDEAQTELITGGEDEYVLRFKTLEWLQRLSAWLKR